MDKLYKPNIIDNRDEEVKEYIIELEGGITLKMNNLKEFNKTLNKGYVEITGKKSKIKKKSIFFNINSKIIKNANFSNKFNNSKNASNFCYFI